MPVASPRHRVQHCALFRRRLFAAAALRGTACPPLILDLASVRDDDHVIAVYRANGYWGAIAKSNYSGLRFRSPVYRTLRELALSYFEHYYNLKGEKTLRAYSRPVNLTRFDSIDWMTSRRAALGDSGIPLRNRPHADFQWLQPPNVYGREAVSGRTGRQGGVTTEILQKAPGRQSPLHEEGNMLYSDRSL